MFSYQIFQGQILDKDLTNPRQYTVMQIPDGYKMVGVQLPNALKDQSAPLIGSTVLVTQIDDYNSYIIAVLREPFEFLTGNQQFRGFIPDINENLANPIQDGEIFMEATGTSQPSGVPGTGAHLYLGNNGCAQIESGSMGERLIVGGTMSDDDHEVVLSGNNGFFESNVTIGTNVQSTFNFDELHNIQIANVVSVPNALDIPISELTMDSFGNIELRNTTLGVDKAAIKLDAIGNITLDGLTINLNSGTLGVARLTDTTLADPTSDPAFWTFWLQQAAIFAALPPATNPADVIVLANALKAALTLLCQNFPQSITGKIVTSSATVLAGD